MCITCEVEGAAQLLIKFATWAKRYAEVSLCCERVAYRKEISECKRLADEAGVFFKIRDYTPPEK